MSYGVDVWCTDSMVTGRLASGADVVIQGMYRRLITRRGTLRGGESEEAYGFNVAGYVGAVGVDLALVSLPGQVRAELMKDDRIFSLGITARAVTDDAGLTTIFLDILGQLVDEEEDFEFTVSIEDVTVQLLRSAT